MSKVYHTISLFNELKKIIQLPENVVSLDLHLDNQSTPTLTLEVETTYPEGCTPVSDRFETETNEFVIVPPWEAKNEHGEYPDGICCQRATGRYCYEHDPENYK